MSKSALVNEGDTAFTCLIAQNSNKTYTIWVLTISTDYTQLPPCHKRGT